MIRGIGKLHTHIFRAVLRIVKNKIVYEIGVSFLSSNPYEVIAENKSLKILSSQYYNNNKIYLSIDFLLYF